MTTEALRANIAIQADNVKTLEASKYVSANDPQLVRSRRRLAQLRTELARRDAKAV